MRVSHVLLSDVFIQQGWVAEQMAIFNSKIKADTTGKAKLPNIQEQGIQIINLGVDVLIAVQLNEYYVDFGGSFTLDASGEPVGPLDTLTVHKNDASGRVVQTWDADGGSYDVKKLFDIEEKKGSFFTGQKAIAKWLFRLDDEVHGSKKNDKLSGHKGDDLIDGRAGNDKLFGGPGNDAFYFAKGYRQDTIKDFELKKDTILIDSDLASNFNKVKKVAEKYKKGVELDFSSKDSLKIEGLKMKNLKKVDFDFDM